MKFRHTLLFAAAFAGVFTMYAAQNKREAVRRDNALRATDDFKVQVEEKNPQLKMMEKINFLQVQDLKRDQTFWMEKEDGTWNIVMPVKALADQNMAQGMAAMAKLAMEAKVMRPDSDWKEYGLAEPEFKIGVGTTGSEERHFLYLGAQSPLGKGVYARWDENNAYFLLPPQVNDAFRKSVYEMREKRVFLTPLSKIDHVYIDVSGRTFEMSLKGGAWYWLEPIEMLGKPVAQDQMAAVLQTLGRLHVKEYMDNKENDVFKAGGVTLISDRLQVRSGKNTETIYLGNEVPLKTAYYAHRENEKTLFLIDQPKVIEILDLVDALDQVNAAAAAKQPETEPAKAPAAP